MRHVREIRKLVEDGATEEAFKALDNLLFLGPQNTEALKIKAGLFAHQGRFHEEAEVWDRILKLDQEDADVGSYYHKRYLEEREKFYFTDELPTGGRRFSAHPRSLIYTAMFGLFGCTLFLVLAGLAREYAILGTPTVSLGLFGLLVVCPWIVIIVHYLRTLREVVVSPDGLIVSTRTKKYELNWDDVGTIHLVHDSRKGGESLSLFIVPKTDAHTAIEIDVADRTSSVRAPTFFVHEIIKMFGNPMYSPKDKIFLAGKSRTVVSF